VKQFAIIAILFAMSATFAFAGTWTGRLVDAACKATNEGRDSSVASCAATTATHLFAVELADAKVLNLDAAGNEKAADAVKNNQKTDLHATVTGSLEGQTTVKVEKIEIQ
jgi:hypothetical protein